MAGSTPISPAFTFCFGGFTTSLPIKHGKPSLITIRFFRQYNSGTCFTFCYVCRM